jgi:hypothetical protein
MASIVPFLRPEYGSFDDEMTSLMGKAFDLAAQELAGRSPGIYETVASRIIVAAQRGERDPAQLCRAGTVGIGKCC